jgi:glycosyltransferase involved in cell wall biosynthesis
VKILFVDQYAQLGGAQQCLLEVLAAVAGSGWRAQLCLPEPGPLEQSARAVGAEIFFEPFGSFSATRKTLSETPRYVGESLRLARALESRIKADRPDLLYVNGPRPLPAAAWAARRMRLPLIFHCHSRLSQSSAIRLANIALRINPTRLIACCRFAAEPLKRAIRDDRFHLIYNGVRGPGASEPPPRTTRQRSVGVIGRIAPEKGQTEFVDAARLVMLQVPDCRFVICGEALFATPAVVRYAEEVRRRAKDLPVEFLGWRPDVYPVMASLDVLVAPSVREPATTRVILEAFACGVPVIAFASGGIGEILTDGETGVLVKEQTAAALAEAIVTLLRAGDGELSRLGANGRREWHSRYTVERFQRDVMKVIDQAAGTT